MAVLITLFSRVPMFFFGGVTMYGYQKYYNHEQIFKNGFKCGINELLADDYQKPVTDTKFNMHYKYYLKNNLKDYNSKDYNSCLKDYNLYLKDYHI